MNELYVNEIYVERKGLFSYDETIKMELEDYLKGLIIL